MVIIKLSTVDPSNYFNLNGLDIQKGLFEVHYGNVEETAGVIDTSALRVGLKRTSNGEQEQPPVIVSEWLDGDNSDTPFASLSALLIALSSLLGLSAVSGSGSEFGRLPTTEDNDVKTADFTILEGYIQASITNTGLDELGAPNTGNIFVNRVKLPADTPFTVTLNLNDAEFDTVITVDQDATYYVRELR